MIKKVGLIFADAMEYSPFEKYALENGGKKGTLNSNETVSLTVKNGDREIEAIAVKSGIGKVNAAFAAASLIIGENVDFILNAGLSGAVSRCKREDIILGESYVECDFDATQIGYALGEKPDEEKYILPADKTLLKLGKMSNGVLSGNLGTGDIFLTDSKRKNLYKETFSISAFDMESAAIAFACNKCNVPFLSVRKISDDADDSAVSNYREMNEREEACLTEVLLNIISRMFNENSIW